MQSLASVLSPDSGQPESCACLLPTATRGDAPPAGNLLVQPGGWPAQDSQRPRPGLEARAPSGGRGCCGGVPQCPLASARNMWWLQGPGSLVSSRPGPQSSPRLPSRDGRWQVGYSGPSPPRGMSALPLKLWEGVSAKKAPYPGPVACHPCWAPGEELSSNLATAQLCLAARCFPSPDLGSSLSPQTPKPSPCQQPTGPRASRSVPPCVPRRAHVEPNDTKARNRDKANRKYPGPWGWMWPHVTRPSQTLCTCYSPGNKQRTHHLPGVAG